MVGDCVGGVVGRREGEYVNTGIIRGGIGFEKKLLLKLLYLVREKILLPVEDGEVLETIGTALSAVWPY